VLIDNSDAGAATPGRPTIAPCTSDNTLAFSQYTLGHDQPVALYRIQVFPRGLIGKLRALTGEAIIAALGHDDDVLGPLVSEAELRAMLSRRDHLLEYVDGLITELGEDAVLALP
jgi:hypothetical protein